MKRTAFVAFAIFGAFWGVWGASVPRVQQQAAIGAGELGFALLFIGAGALPAMLLVGRALDRWGLRVAALATGALGLAGAGLVLTAVNLPSLCAGLAVVGATSGAADVANNAVAGRAEKVAGQPVITRAHGWFSSLVVLATLATGLGSAASLPLAVPFVAVAGLALLAGAVMLKTLPAGEAAPRSGAARGGGLAGREEVPRSGAARGGGLAGREEVPRSGAARGGGRARHEEAPPSVADGRSAPAGRWRVAPLLLIGVLGALAFASENAHQSWSAVFANDVLHTGLGLSAVAPAVFAGTVAVTRFAAGGLGAAHARAVLFAGAVVAAAGAAIIAVAPTLFVAGLGLAAAAAGTGVLFPTLVGVVSRNVDESYRGRATSVVTTVSYLGFLVGPVYVGLWADAVGLRGAMVAVAALAVGLLVLAPVLLRLSGFLNGSWPAHGGRPSTAAPTPRQVWADAASPDRPGPGAAGDAGRGV